MPHKKYDQWIEKHYIQIRILNYYDFFFFSGVGFILYPEIFYLITMILQRIRIIVGDAGFESRDLCNQKSGPLPMSHHISLLITLVCQCYS